MPVEPLPLPDGRGRRWKPFPGSRFPEAVSRKPFPEAVSRIEVKTKMLITLVLEQLEEFCLLF